MYNIPLFCLLLAGTSTLCQASPTIRQRAPAPIANVAMLECTEANYGGRCVLTADVSKGDCHQRNRQGGQGYGLKGSIQLGASLICKIYQDGFCESAKSVANVLPSSPILQDFSHPFWRTAGFMAGGPGPESWRCRVFDGKFDIPKE